MKRKTKIICTLGPATSSLSMIDQLASVGMDVARINFSHGTQEQHQSQIDLIRRVSQQRKKKIFVLQDLQGYRIRIGQLKSPRPLSPNQILFLTSQNKEDKDHIPFDFQGDLRQIKAGLYIYLDDGKMALKVLGVQNESLRVQVIQGGLLQSRKGINIPGLKLTTDILTSQDKSDIEFGIKNSVDYIAQSFVRNKKDMARVIDLAKNKLPKAQFIAKIENEQGLKNLETIMDVCDGIMVARGDLGISLPIYKIAIIQKEIIKKCNRRKKFAITATQMLESMIESPRPTRAEVSDVTNAILDGSEFVMLSAETAVGKFPVETVGMMRKIVEFTEKAK